MVVNSAENFDGNADGLGSKGSRGEPTDADFLSPQGSSRGESEGSDEKTNGCKERDVDCNVKEEHEGTGPFEAFPEEGRDGRTAAAAETKDDEHLVDLQRLQAEYVNYRRRVERDRDVARETAVQGMVISLLPVLDDIDAARQHGDLKDGPFAAIAQKIDDTLAKHGVRRYGETGVAFDPTIYEALLQQPSAEVDQETVSQVLRPGYRMGERIIRAAQVAVSVPE